MAEIVSTRQPNVIMDKETIENIYTNNDIVPKIIEVAPSDLLTIEYVQTGKQVLPGQELAPKDVPDAPKVTYNSDGENAIYTLIMIDPDAPSRSFPVFSEVLHWLVVNIPGAKVEDGQVIAEYAGAGPLKYTKLHRYAFLLYKQPQEIDFSEQPKSGKGELGNRMRFSVKKFVERYGLGQPVAGNFYMAQNDESVPGIFSRVTGCFRRRQ